MPLFEQLELGSTEKPKPRPEVPPFAAWLVPPLCDVFQPKECFLWLHLIYLKGDEDLTLDVCATRELGEIAEWAENKYDDFEPSDILDPGWSSIPAVGGWMFSTRWLEWGLRQGLCPGQPFLCWFAEPDWYKCSYESDEWDVIHDWKIVRQMPRTNAQASRSWGRALAQINKHRDWARKKMAELVHKRAYDVSVMSIKSRGYGDWNRGDNGIVFSLCTKHTSIHGLAKHGSYCLAEGRDDGGDCEAAYEDLVRCALEKFPHLDRERLDCLRNKRVYRPTAWEHIMGVGSRYP